MKTPVFVFVLSLVQANALICYQCDPRSEGNCESPDKNHITTTVCEDSNQTANVDTMTLTNTTIEMSNNSTEPILCYYLYFETGIPESTGFYRGCSKQDYMVLEFCESLNNRLEKNGLPGKMNCKTCATDQCNVGNLRTGKSLVGGVRDSTKGAATREALNLFIHVLIGFYVLHF